MSVPEERKGAVSAARSLRSTNRAFAVLTSRRLRIRCSTPHCASAAGAAPQTSASSAARTIRSAPVIIEIEPVVGREPAVMLEARGVFLHRLVHEPLALPTLRSAQILDQLEVDVVAVAAAVKADHQYERAPEHGGEAER